MKRSLSVVLITATLAMCGVHADEGPVAAHAPAPDQALRSLGWLEGRWHGTTSDGETFEAIYSSPDGGVILSINKCVAADRVTFVEFERFEVREGRVVMTPFPDGRRAASFALAEHDLAARRAVFTNPANDFPDRVAYERTSDDALRIVVSGAPGGERMELVLDLRRS